MGIELLSGPEALVPRMETELVAHVALDIARGQLAGVASPRILDVCTGSGNIALALAHHLPETLVGGCDLSKAAVSLAKRNSGHLHLADRVEFRAGDLLNPFCDEDWTGKVDLITCNPPYISSTKVPEMAREIAEHEPFMAFDGGPFGVSILMRLMQDAPPLLRPGGWIAFEVGLGQGSAMEKRLKTSGQFQSITAHPDSEGRIRVLSARRA
jgi:release factor glutamine methyltransferase